MADRWRDEYRRWGGGPGYRDRDDDRFGRYGGGSGERDFGRPFDGGQPGTGGAGRRIWPEDGWLGRDDRGARGYGQDWRGPDRDRDDRSRQEWGRQEWGRQFADKNRDRYGDRDNARDWMDRAGDEVASWFGDDEAERRRRKDERRDEDAHRRRYGYPQGGRDRFRNDW